MKQRRTVAQNEVVECMMIGNVAKDCRIIQLAQSLCSESIANWQNVKHLASICGNIQ
jgi:hypothetical protein